VERDEMENRMVLFRVAAGPRIGFGHLMRCRSLAAALGWNHRFSLRGPQSAIRSAARLGCVLAPSDTRRALGGKVDLVVVDDPAAEPAQRWADAARRRMIPVASLHDLGIAPIRVDLAVDGSVCPGRLQGATRRLTGPRYAVVHSDYAAMRRADRGASSSRRRVLIALGGGSRQRLAVSLSDAILRSDSGLDVRVAGGFASNRRPFQSGSSAFLGPRASLASELSRCDVAIVGGGLTLYEASCAGVAAIAVPVVAAQRPTIRGFVRHGCAMPLGAGHLPGSGRPSAGFLAAAVTRVVGLAGNGAARRQMARAGRRLIDGRGAERVAAELRTLVSRRTCGPEAR
jgi:spore coat polysaccharide biosynthesis predicted glycosyltransferase SpsG